MTIIDSIMSMFKIMKKGISMVSISRNIISIFQNSKRYEEGQSFCSGFVKEHQMIVVTFFKEKMSKIRMIEAEL